MKKQLLAKKPPSVKKFKNISEVFHFLPKTEKAMLRNKAGYPFKLVKMDEPHKWRVVLDGKELGFVGYLYGRKLVAWEIAE
jgi:hypothetical protein